MSRENRFTIGQLARRAEIPATTLRYYERIGLLVPEGRSHGNYRLYDEASARRLRFIRSAQSIGFTLDDIRSLLGSQHRKGPSCDDVQEMIKQRLAEIEQRMAGLREVQNLLRSALKKCQQPTRKMSCHVIETLEAECS